MRCSLLLLGLASVACEGAPPKRPASPTPVATVEMRAPPPLAVRDAGVEAAAPPLDKNRVGPFHVIARSEGAPFRMYRLGEDVIVRAGQSVAKLEGDELTPLPTFFDGISVWEGIKIGKDKAFDGWRPEHDVSRDQWEGYRRVRAITGGSLNDVWVVTERGHYQMWVGEAWRRSAANAPLKLVKDLGKADRTFAAAAISKPDVLYGLVHPYADNGRLGDTLYRFEVVGNGPRPQLGATPKDCLAQVYPRDLLAFPTGEAMVYGQRCGHLNRAASVARWDARGSGPTLDVLPAPERDGSVNLEGAIALERNDVWVFGGATAPNAKNATNDPPLLAYLAHFDGKKWSIVDAPDADPLTHLVKASDGSLAAFAWPTAFFTRDGANGRWVKHDLDPVLSRVRALSVWYGKSNDLYIAGSYDEKGYVGVVLHTKPAKTIFETKDESSGDD